MKESDDILDPELDVPEDDVEENSAIEDDREAEATEEPEQSDE